MHEKLLNTMLANECHMDAKNDEPGAPSLFVWETHCAGDLWIVAKLQIPMRDYKHDILAYRWRGDRTHREMQVWAEGYLGR